MNGWIGVIDNERSDFLCHRSGIDGGTFRQPVKGGGN
jgi:hypothetical protein